MRQTSHLPIKTRNNDDDWHFCLEFSKMYVYVMLCNEFYMYSYTVRIVLFSHTLQLTTLFLYIHNKDIQTVSLSARHVADSTVVIFIPPRQVNQRSLGVL